MSSDNTDQEIDQLFEVDIGIDEKPEQFASRIILGIQHFLTMSAGVILGSLAFAGVLGMSDAAPEQVGVLVSTFFVAAGVTTAVQSKFGMRYPLVQTSALAYLPPIIAVVGVVSGQDPGIAVWRASLLEIMGAIMAAGVVQTAIGASGIVGRLRDYISPVIIAPTIALIGLSIIDIPFVIRADQDWIMTGFTVLLMISFSQLLDQKHKIFRMYPIILGLIVAYVVALVLTVLGIYTTASASYVDIARVAAAEPVRLVHPLQWGVPRFTFAFFVGMLSAVFVSVIESFGDYHAVATVSGYAAPSSKRINFGIATEGLGSIVGGSMGSFGMTSASENIGAIAISHVASRNVVFWGGISMIVVASVGYFGQLVATIPDAILAGLFLVVLGQVIGVALAQLNPIDLTSNRNLFVVGFTLYTGMVIPGYVSNVAGADAFQSGMAGLFLVGPILGQELISDTVFTILSSNMSVGVIVGLILDNVIPGTDEERGLTAWADFAETDDEFETYLDERRKRNGESANE